MAHCAGVNGRKREMELPRLATGLFIENNLFPPLKTVRGNNIMQKRRNTYILGHIGRVAE